MQINGNTFRAAALTGVRTPAFFGLSAAVGAGVVTVGIAAYLAYQCFNGGGGNPVNGRRLPAFLERRPQQSAAVSLNATSQGRHLSSVTPDRKLARVF